MNHIKDNHEHKWIEVQRERRGWEDLNQSGMHDEKCSICGEVRTYDTSD